MILVNSVPTTGIHTMIMESEDAIEEVKNNTCDSAIFPVNGMYTRVCGKVLAYSRRDPDAFLNALIALNGHM